MKENYFAKREGRRRKYNKACGEWAERYGFEFMNTHRNVIFRKTSDDKYMLYTIERQSRMAVATVLQISSRRLGLWLKERNSFSDKNNSREHGYGIIYRSIFRYDSDHGFHPENVEEYLDEIKLKCFPILGKYKDKIPLQNILRTTDRIMIYVHGHWIICCVPPKKYLEFFLINHFRASDKSKIKDEIRAEISDERHDSYWITKLTKKGVL